LAFFDGGTTDDAEAIARLRRKLAVWCRSMADIGIFDLLPILERRGIVKPMEFSSAFCDCCGKQHRRQWYRHEKTGDSFYVCTITMMGMVNYQSGNWGRVQSRSCALFPGFWGCI